MEKEFEDIVRWIHHASLKFQSVFRHYRFLPVFWRSWAVGITLPGQIGDFLTTLWQLKGRSADLSFVAGRLIEKTGKRGARAYQAVPTASQEPPT